MANKRMFARTIVESDAFLDMPATTRLLYYDLNMRADDDGFLNAPKKVLRETGASADDMNLLLLKKFVISFETGIVVIKHWKIHNYIQADRYNETKYKAEKATLLLDENKAYTVSDGSVYTLDTQNKIREEEEEMAEPIKTDSQLIKAMIEEKVDTSLHESFYEYLRVRKKNKIDTTPFAVKLLITALDKESKGDVVYAKAIIEQSILKAYKSFFAITQYQQHQKTSDKQGRSGEEMWEKAGMKQ